MVLTVIWSYSETNWQLKIQLYHSWEVLRYVIAMFYSLGSLRVDNPTFMQH